LQIEATTSDDNANRRVTITTGTQQLHTKNISASSYQDDRRKSIKLPFAKNILHKLSQSMHIKNNFRIEERRRKVASMLAQSMTETEIAEQLNVNQSTVSRDVRAQRNVTTICL
jgi:DNA-binding NarL/FixJ family response regulator